MGYLLRAINQTELDEQRGVVQNEKRMHDDRPPTSVPTLPARANETVNDRVSQPYLYRAWAVARITASDAAALQVAAVASRALDAAIVKAARTPRSPGSIERYLAGEFTQRITEAAMNGGGIGQVVNGMRMGQGPDWYRWWQAALVAVAPGAAATKWRERPPMR